MFRNNFIAGTHHIKAGDQSQSNLFKQAKFFCSIADIHVRDNCFVKIIVAGTYSGCQKNVPVFKRFFLQPLMPHFRISEHYYGKRYI